LEGDTFLNYKYLNKNVNVVKFGTKEVCGVVN